MCASSLPAECNAYIGIAVSALRTGGSALVEAILQTSWTGLGHNYLLGIKGVFSVKSAPYDQRRFGPYAFADSSKAALGLLALFILFDVCAPSRFDFARHIPPAALGELRQLLSQRVPPCLDRRHASHEFADLPCERVVWRLP